jgi:hypothetical protein
MKDTKTILLALLSFGLVATWVYHIYDKTKYAGVEKAIEKKDIVPGIYSIQDSLQQVYSSTLNKLGYQLDSAKNTAGLLQSELKARLDEINLLRTEIADLLRKNNVKKEDLEMVGKKTTRFQQLVAELPNKNNGNTEEKKHTPSVADNLNTNEAMQGSNQNAVPITAPVFTATDLRFIPIKVTNDMEEETSEADNASKLVISFTVKNNVTGFNNAEVFAVVTQPDGKVMQTDVWETAYISTHDFGKKVYTRKMKFEYQKGETKQLQLTLKPEDYEKGNYRLQVFHNGYLIGETVKTLN